MHALTSDTLPKLRTLTKSNFCMIEINLQQNCPSVLKLFQLWNIKIALCIYD